MTPPSSTATADAHAAGGPITLRDLVQLLASAAGLSVYLVLLGGIVYWGQLSSAGLPADSLLSTADPRELMAIGVRSLLRGPVVILVLLALSAALPHIAAAVRSDRKFPRRLLQVGIVLIAVVVGFMLLYLGVALALLALGLGALLGEQLDAAPGPGVLPRMLLGVVAAAVVIWKIRRGRAAAAPRPTADLPAYVAPVRWAVAVRQWLALWVPLWLLTVVLLELLVSWYLLDAVALQAAALVVATLPFVYWTAALSVWLWTTTDRVTVETVQTGKGVLWIAVVAVLFAVLMPLWLTTFVIGIVIVVWLLELRPRRGKTEEAPAEQDTASWLASDWRLRTLLLAGVISVTAVCLGGHPAGHLRPCGSTRALRRSRRRRLCGHPR